MCKHITTCERNMLSWSCKKITMSYFDSHKYTNEMEYNQGILITFLCVCVFIDCFQCYINVRILPPLKK